VEMRSARWKSFSDVEGREGRDAFLPLATHMPDVVPISTPPPGTSNTHTVEALSVSGSDLNYKPTSDREHREARRDEVARWLALGMLFLFGITVLLPLVYWLVRGTASPEMVGYTKDIAAIETAILAGIIGFYFAATRV
jgi:hypothetical protein